MITIIIMTSYVLSSLWPVPLGHGKLLIFPSMLWSPLITLSVAMVLAV